MHALPSLGDIYMHIQLLAYIFCMNIQYIVCMSNIINVKRLHIDHLSSISYTMPFGECISLGSTRVHANDFDCVAILTRYCCLESVRYYGFMDRVLSSIFSAHSGNQEVQRQQTRSATCMLVISKVT